VKNLEVYISAGNSAQRIEEKSDLQTSVIEYGKDRQEAFDFFFRCEESGREAQGLQGFFPAVAHAKQCLRRLSGS
jgi:hypothetical protein